MVKIISMHIYGYGKFIDFNLDHFADLQIIFGENEAGKSTIMAFIHSILFGFPSRQQNSLRYEPKFHSAYGGKIRVETNEFGVVTIERVKGKSAGDVVVTLADGTIGGEELLSKVLCGMNLETFQNIFSFNLQGLQEIERLKGEELSRYLIAAGSVGTDKLLYSQQQLQKEMDLLFKPAGRKPLLNQRLQELRNADSLLKEAIQQNRQYETLLFNKVTLETQFSETDAEIRQLSTELQSINELLKKWPSLEKREQISQQLTQLGSISFPADGMNRFEKYTERMIELTSKRKSIEEKLEETSALLKDHAPESVLIQEVDQVEKLIAEWPLFQQIEREQSDIHNKVENISERIAMIRLNIHFPEEQSIEDIDLSMTMKDRIKEGIRKKVSLEARLSDIQNQWMDQSKKLERIEKKCQSIESQLLPEVEFKQLQKEKEKWGHVAQLEKEKEYLEQMLTKEANKKTNRKKLIIFNWLLIIGWVTYLGWTYFSNAQLPLATTIAFSIIVIFISYYNYSNRNDHYDQSLAKRIQEVTSLLENRPNNHSLAIFDEQIQLRDQWKNIFQLVAQYQQQLDEIKQQEQDYLLLFRKVEKEMKIIKSELRLPPSFSDFRLDDAYERLVELQQLSREKQQLTRELKEKKAIQTRWVTNLEELAQKLSFTFDTPAHGYFQIRRLVKNEEEKQIILKELSKKKQELEDEKSFVLREQKEYQSFIQKLFKLANVEDEEHFRKQAIAWEEQQHLKEQWDLLSSMFHDQLLDLYTSYKTENEVKEHQAYLIEMVQNKRQQLENFRKQIVETDHKIKLLEDGGTYTERLHHFHSLRFSFNEEAKKWVKLALAHTILQNTMDAYIKERLPKVVTIASEYMSLLTNGAYSEVKLQKNGAFMVKRQDDTFFYPIELSQGTKEQLYTALRFALVIVLQKDYPFPIIIDDSFVNFDRQRTGKVLSLIKELSKTTQILLFTCHEHIRDAFKQQEILYLSNKVRV